MIYTVRYAHLQKEPEFIIGDIIKRGNIIGSMGSSGQSTAAHLHIDCVVGRIGRIWTLQEMEELALIPAFKQLNYFIDYELFNTDIAVTTFFNDPEYMDDFKKVHLAYDVVPANRDPGFFRIYWNRSMMGQVTGKGYHSGYGNYLLVAFDA